MQASKSCSDDHYSYLVTWSAEDSAFVGTCLECPGLSHVAQDRAEALSGIETLVGEFMTRVPAELHRRLAMEVAETGVSLKRLVSFKLALPMRSGRPAATKSRKDALERGRRGWEAS